MKIGRIIGKILKIVAVIGGILGVSYIGEKRLEKSDELKERYKAYYQLLSQWLVNNNEDKKIEKYFKEKSINVIAIYGMGTLGELFYNEIKKTDLKIAYFVDKNAEKIYNGIDDISVVGVHDIAKQEIVDAIIITPVFDFEKIKNDLEKETSIYFASLEDIIFGI